jgi:hypothetical protein
MAIPGASVHSFTCIPEQGGMVKREITLCTGTVAGFSFLAKHSALWLMCVYHTVLLCKNHYRMNLVKFPRQLFIQLSF